MAKQEGERDKRMALACRVGYHADEKVWRQYWCNADGKPRPNPGPDEVRKSQRGLAAKMGIVPKKKGTDRRATI